MAKPAKRLTQARVLDVYDLMHYFAMRGPFRPRDEVLHWLYGRRDVKASSRERAWERLKVAARALGFVITTRQTSEMTWEVCIHEAWRNRERVGDMIDARAEAGRLRRQKAQRRYRDERKRRDAVA